MTQTSSYLRYLPPVLWENEPPEGELSLGTVLCIFEKLLTGIDDDVPLLDRRVERAIDEQRLRGAAGQAGGLRSRPLPAITAQIARVHELFDPQRTPPEFLPWLAGWVALEFPTLQGQPIWDEYQQRKVTAEIAGIYRLRGLRAGLNRYLSLYGVGETRPRVAIDDGSRLLVTTPQPGQVSPITALVSQGPVIAADKTLVSEGLIRPGSLARGADGSLFAGDLGLLPTVVIQKPDQPSWKGYRVWRFPAGGGYQMAGAPARPQPLAPGFLFNSKVVAVAVRPPLPGTPETLYVLDDAGTLYQMPAPYTAALFTQMTVLTGANVPIKPVALAVDNNGDLLILDRGTQDDVAIPRVITVQLGHNPRTAIQQGLRGVVEPLSLLVQPDGALVIGDGREQQPAAPQQFWGNLALVERSDPAHWGEAVLLLKDDDPEAPPGARLVAPVALSRDAQGRLYVLDAGLKPFNPPPDPFLVAVAEPAAVYQVDLNAAAPTVTRVGETGRLVYPTGMVSDGERLFICDPGHPGVRPGWSPLPPGHFGVVLHFAEPRLPPAGPERDNVQRRVAGNIASIIDQQKPAHTVWTWIATLPS